jgi:hypothetical protein
MGNALIYWRSQAPSASMRQKPALEMSLLDGLDRTGSRRLGVTRRAECFGDGFIGVKRHLPVVIIVAERTHDELWTGASRAIASCGSTLAAS